MTTLLSNLETQPLPTRSRRISSPPLALEPAEWLTGLETILLTPGRYTIGSDTDSTIVLNSGGVRLRHCLIVVGPKRTVLKAWDTFTWLNEAPVDESVLKPGDRLAIGPVEFVVRRATADDLMDSELGPAVDMGVQPESRVDSSATDSATAEQKIVVARRVEPDDSAPDELLQEAVDANHLQLELKTELQGLRDEIVKQKQRLQETISAAGHAAKETEDTTAAIAAKVEMVDAQLRREREDLARLANGTAIEAALLRQAAERAAESSRALGDRERELALREEKLNTNDASRLQVESEEQERLQRVAVAEQEILKKTEALEQLSNELQQSEETVEEELQALRERVDCWSTEQDEARGVVESRLSSVAKIEADLTVCQSQLDERIETVQALETRLENERLELERREAELAAEVNRVAEQRSDTSDKAAEEQGRLESQLQEQSEKVDEIARKTEQLNARELMLERREQELGEQRSELESKRIELESQEQDVQQRAESLPQRLDEIGTRESRLEEAELSLKGELEQVALERDELQQRSGELNERAQQLERDQDDATQQRECIDEERRQLDEERLQFESSLESTPVASNTEEPEVSTENSVSEDLFAVEGGGNTVGEDAIADSNEQDVEKLTGLDEVSTDDPWVPSEDAISEAGSTNEESASEAPNDDWTPVEMNVVETEESDAPKSVTDTDTADTDTDDISDLRSNLADMFDMNDATTNSSSENSPSTDDVSDDMPDAELAQEETSDDASEPSVWETMFPEDGQKVHRSEAVEGRGDRR